MNKKIDDLIKQGYYIAIVNGKECPNLESILSNIATAFQFPDYYGENLNAFNECINDLEWIDETKYALIINESDNLLSSDDQFTVTDFTNLLDAVKKEWAQVPNFDDEDIYRQKADFKVLYL